MTTPRSVTADTIVMRQIAALFRESPDPAVVRAAALALANGALLLVEPPTDREKRTGLELLARAWNQGHGCTHLADDDEWIVGFETEPCRVCGRFYVDE